MLRTFIERISRGRSFRRNLPASYGNRPLHVSPDSALVYLKRNWVSSQRALLDAASKYATEMNSIWDIGANVGAFTFAAAHVAGPNSETVALEADPFLASLLQATATESVNRDRNVNVICAAATNSIGIARFLIAERGRASNSLERSGHRSQAGGTRFVQHVPTVTLDSLLDHFLKPGLVKIDVEGAEAYVLRGAERVLSECRPLFYIEVGSDQCEEATKLFQDHGYRLYDGDANNGLEIQRCCYNTLAVPKESKRTNKQIASPECRPG